jgi:hypothetical protein
MSDDDRVAGRADLTAEEKAAGSGDPHEQARLIIEESDARQEDRDAAPDSVVEHRTSEDTVEPPPSS